MADQLKSGVVEFARSNLWMHSSDELGSMMHYVRSTFEDEDGYKRLKANWMSWGLSPLFYLAAPPKITPPLFRRSAKLI